MEKGENIVREVWTSEDGYLAFMQGMDYIWKIILYPKKTTAGNDIFCKSSYIFSKEGLKARDWKKFKLPEPAI